jgi:hypothetical protein
MSLKAFHVIFITAASAMAFGCGVWGIKNYFSPDGRLVELIFGIGAIVVGVALIIYERYFLKKLKNISYL